MSAQNRGLWGERVARRSKRVVTPTPLATRRSLSEQRVGNRGQSGEGAPCPCLYTPRESYADAQRGRSNGVWETGGLEQPLPFGLDVTTHSQNLEAVGRSHTRDSADEAGPAEGVDTVFDVLSYAARTHGSKKALASREIERMISEEKDVKKMINGKEETIKKKWQYFKLTPLSWISYDELLQQVREIGSGLRALGVGGPDETFFNIYASTG